MPRIPPSSENRNPEIEIASPPQRSGNMLPAVDPTKNPIQINFFVMARRVGGHYRNRIRVPRSTDIFNSSADTLEGKYAPEMRAR